MGTSSRGKNARRTILAWPFMRDVTGARAAWNGHYGRHRMGGGRGPVPSALASGTRAGESALPLPPSLVAAGEPHPLPMERTSLTVSVALCASTTVSVPSY